ncbi:hypothetical protein BDV95DRAFT_605534 [Massariosphaeria phaeospora]|uniref:Mid2 domain-containing protein n=1 Tax=Massariosphaeria phaeospora TaxID=100035 RepID=A0A7C8I806_9PLEO|nr:hypothetical protein BDV95DRAFT_605534 [Massariosphaeria phaeospora]
MNASLFVLILLMLFSDDVWAVYGVMVNRDMSYSDCFPSQTVARVSDLQTTLLQPTRFANTTSTSSVSVSSSSCTPTHTSATLLPTSPSSSAPPAPPAKQTKEWATPTKIGIGVTVGVIGILIAALVLFIALHVRRKNTERAMQRAVEEVESGVTKESQEMIVLESRVSIVVDNDDDEEEDEEEERGRNGMSLARRWAQT